MEPSHSRIVFVAGMHRSGTSLLHRVLAAHPDVSGFSGTGAPEDEGQHLQTVYPPARVFGGPGRFGFDPRSHMDEHHELATPGNAERLFSEWSSHWNLDASLLVEKSPPNIVRTRFLQALFPEASFIVLLRHPIAVSCATAKWAPRKGGLGRLVEHWLVCHERFEADRPHLRRVLTLRYEDLVGAPEDELRRIWRFLDLESLPVTEPVRTGINEKYFRRWESLRRGLFTRRAIHRAVERLEPRLRPFGYSLHDPERELAGASAGTGKPEA